MDSQSIKEVFKELYSHLERLETQNTAILLFLKEKKRVTDKQLAPYLEQAGNAANVKWRAERVRMEYLLAQAPEEAISDEKSEKESAAPAEIEQKKSEAKQKSPEVEQKPEVAQKKVEQKSPEVEQKTSGQEEQEQAAEGSGEQDDLKKQKKAASGEGNKVERDKEEVAQAMSEQNPEKHQDSSHPAEVQAESVHELGDEKKEGGQKVA